MGIEEITEGDGEGEKGRFWGGGDRQSHRGPALSLTGWGSPPGRRGKGCPQIPPPATPLTTLSPLSRPLCFPCLPLFLAHTAAPPSLLHAPLHACLPLPSLGYNFAQICPLAVLHTPPSLQLASPLCSVSLAHIAFLFPHSMPPVLSNSCLHTLPLASSLTHLTSENFWALAADTLGTPFSLTNS